MKIAMRRYLTPTCFLCNFEQLELRNENSKSLQVPWAFGRSTAASSADAAFRVANAVSIADIGVRFAHAVCDDVSRCFVTEHPAVAKDKVAIAIQAMIVCRPCERGTNRTAESPPTASTLNGLGTRRAGFIFDSPPCLARCSRLHRDHSRCSVIGMKRRCVPRTSAPYRRTLGLRWGLQYRGRPPNALAFSHQSVTAWLQKIKVMAATTRTLAVSIRISATSKPENIGTFDMGTSLKYPTPVERELGNRGGIVITEPRRSSLR
jgi:hypothetical protein